MIDHFYDVDEKQKALDDHILDYQEADYDSFELHGNHMRVKRSLDSHLYLRFKAYNRDFHLKLKKAENIFSENHMTVNNEGNLEPVDTSFIYEGSLVDDPNSFAHIAIINGTARGHIRVPGDTTYYIEPSARFFHKPGFHSVIYPEKHMNLDPYRQYRENGTSEWNGAKLWMDRTSQARFRRSERKPEPRKSNKRVKHPLKNICVLYLRSDPTLWLYIKNKKYMDRNMSDDQVKAEIQAFFASHVATLKYIFSMTTFEMYDKSVAYRGITFLVQKTQIMTDKSEQCGTENASEFCRNDIDDNSFLLLNSMKNHDAFCLAFMFAHRNFLQGTLGLAYTGRPSKGLGGICEKNVRIENWEHSLSFNTGIITTLLHGRQVPSHVSELSFTHEVGHSFGSLHDSGVECAPYGTNDPAAEDGNYLMFPRATTGMKKNNNVFSSCSKDNITRVLSAVFAQQYDKVNCFAAHENAVCGNGIIEDGEECDCGHSDTCQDECCNPSSSPEKPCQLKTIQGAKVQCSPTQGSCCNKTCVYVSGSSNHVCRAEDECLIEQYCKGDSAVCPLSLTKPDLTLCRLNSQTCHAGKCSKSLCDSIGWLECSLNQSTKEELCYLSCFNKNTLQCVSSLDAATLNNTANKDFRDLIVKINHNVSQLHGIKLPPGATCNNFRGYCDSFHTCRKIDADGPLTKLKNTMVESIQLIMDWTTDNWWAVILIAVAIIITMAVFIHICAIHTPSSNPNLPDFHCPLFPKMNLHQDPQKVTIQN